MLLINVLITHRGRILSWIMKATHKISPQHYYCLSVTAQETISLYPSKYTSLCVTDYFCCMTLKKTYWYTIIHPNNNDLMDHHHQSLFSSLSSLPNIWLGKDALGFSHMGIVVFQKRYGLLTYGIMLVRFLGWMFSWGGWGQPLLNQQEEAIL